MKEYGKKHLWEFIWAGITAIFFSAAFVGISIILQLQGKWKKQFGYW